MAEQSDTPTVSKLEFETFNTDQEVKPAIELNRLNDISLELQVELGTSKVSLREALGWKRDTIITLEKLAGENVDIYIHGVRFASGEVLVVEDSFAVRITELLSYIERVKLGLGRVSD